MRKKTRSRNLAQIRDEEDGGRHCDLVCALCVLVCLDWRKALGYLCSKVHMGYGQGG